MTSMIYSEMQLIAANENLKEKHYWLNKISGPWVKSSFPYDYEKKWGGTDPGPRSSGLEMESVTFKFNHMLNARMLDICGGSDYALHTLLVAGLTALLTRYLDSDDIIVATPIYKQEVDSDFINTLLAIRTQMNGDISFKDHLLKVRETIRQAVENQNYPVGILAEQLNLPIFEDDFPLFDIVVLLENVHYKKYLQTIPFHLIFSYFRTGDQVIEGRVEYNPFLYRSVTIERIMTHQQKLLENALADVNGQLSCINILSEEERKELLIDFNNTDGDYPGDKTIHRLFTEQVKRTPHDTAVIEKDGTHSLTYSQLNERSNRLARLLKKRGIGPGMIAGIMMDNSLEMIIVILGILKAGAAYLPIGPDLPQNRIVAVLNDSNAAILITKDELMARFKFIPLKDFERRPLQKIITPKRPPVMDLDILQFPNRSLVDYEKYHPFIGQSMVKNSITLQFSRGCMFKCLYCFKIWPDKYVLRTGENLFEEVNMYYKMGVRRFGFTDDLPNFNKKEIGKFYQLVIKNKLNIHMHFPNGIRGDILTPDFIDLMMEAGAVTMDLALETASPRLQKLIRKNVNIERLRRNVEYIIEKYPKAILGVQIMHGFPTETQEEARASLEFIKSFPNLPFGYMHILKIYPNTAMARFAMEYGVSEEDILRSVDLGYHELPYTLPFPESFTRQCQSEYLGDFFLLKERLLKVLPNQMARLTEDELVQKYNSYLPADIKTFSNLLKYISISRDEIKGEFLPEDYGKVENVNKKIRACFPVHESGKDATRLLLMDLSQHFSHEGQGMYHVVDPPLGLMYLLTHLNKTFGPLIKGKIVKSQVDFDSYDELKELIEEFNPHIIGVRTLTYFKNFYHKAISLMRYWGFTGPIIAGGPYATSSCDTMLQDMNIDLAVLEEGEITIAELMRVIMNNDNQLPEEEILKNIQGIAFVSKEQKATQRRINREILMIDHLSGTLSGESAEDPEHIGTSGDMAYIIYTSGSTGIPKGVMVEHGNVVNQLTGLKQRFEPDPSLNYLLLAAYTFDVSVMHMFLALTTGAKIFFITEEIKKDPIKLWQYIHENNINLLNIVPAFMKSIVENIEKGKIHFKYLFVGGDVFDPELYEKLKETFKAEHIINIYGPTETTINAALYLCGDLEPGQRIPIGKPVMNYRTYILDRKLNLVPVGGSGELYISGAGVTRGYLNRPQLTAERFIRVPFKGGEIMYRTGDHARWLPDGNIEFLGRLDQQVKVRGFRIEPGEIEKRFLEIEGIKKAVVLIKEDKGGDKYLCAYVTSDRMQMIPELRECLAAELPNYMIPTYIIQVDTIPLTPGGKIDKRVLLESKFKVSSEYAAPTNDVEVKLEEIWAEVLGMDKETIGINANFFELGGHSLKATILISKIHKNLNVKVPMFELFKAPTIKNLAGYIQEAVQDRFIPLEPVNVREYYALSSAQRRLYVAQQVNPESINYNLAQMVSIEGNTDKNRFEEAFKKLIARHDSLRTSFVLVDEEPVQQIHQAVDFEVACYNAAGSEVGKIIEGFIRPFDLSYAPLLRVGLVNIDDSQGVLLVDMHHIITDGISQNILKTEFLALYAGAELAPLRLQYRDYSEWQQLQLKTGAFKKQEEYWLKEFQGGIAELDMPIDYPRPEMMSFEGDIIDFDLGREETGALNQMALSQGCTLYIVLLAIYNVLLSKVSNQEDIVVGTAAAGRRHADLERIIGVFINMLALRNYPTGEKRFTDFLKEVKKRTLEAFENQDYQLEDLVRKLGLQRDTSRNPLFNVVFAMENTGMDKKNTTQPEPEPVPQERSNAPPYPFKANVTRFELTLTAVENGRKLDFTFQYCTKLFDAETIYRLIGYFKEVVSSVLKSPHKKISEFSIISEAARENLIKKIRDENYNFMKKGQEPSKRTTELEANFDY